VPLPEIGIQPITNFNRTRRLDACAKIMSGVSGVCVPPSGRPAKKKAAPLSAENDAAQMLLPSSPGLLGLVIVVVIVPVVIRMPRMRIFVPPLMLFVPAALALRRQLMTPVVGFLAVGAVVLNGFVEVVVNFCGVALALVVCSESRGREQEESRQHC
jgi:hypothetical protein